MIFADAGERTISVACVQAEAAEASLWRRLLTTREQRILQDVLGTLQHCNRLNVIALLLVLFAQGE